MRHRILLLTLLLELIIAGFPMPIPADTADRQMAVAQPELTPMNYMFIHDASLNMRRRNRIAIMQSSIRSILDEALPTSYAGLRLFGHRFPVDGPDVCEDTELIIPPGPILTTREDFELQLNLLSQPVIGGGAPVGLALQQSLADLQDLPGQKEIFLYLVDLMKCETPDPLEVIRSACEVSDLHLTLIGFGLKSDLQILEEEGIPQLSCVDIINLITNEQAEALSDRLLTRLSVEFRNADGQLTDPDPSRPLELALFPADQDEEVQAVRVKRQTPAMKGSFIETVGLDAGEYLLDLSYQGQKLRDSYPISLTSREASREVIQLGRLFVEVTDSQGKPLPDAEERQVQIVVRDAGIPIRSVNHVPEATFDLLPGTRYTVDVSYAVGGKRLNTRYEEQVTIEEANHKNIRVMLPIGAIAGTVVDMAGNPAPQVEVVLSRLETTESSLDEAVPIREPLMTGTDGTYLFADLDAGKYAVHFGKPGFAIEPAQATVIGGHVMVLEERALFHGFSVDVRGVSGVPVPEASVHIVAKATSVRYPAQPYQQRYRNTEYLPAGNYVVTVEKTGYKSISQEVAIQDEDSAIDVAFMLPYYVTVSGTVIDGKETPLSEAVLEFQNQHSAFLPDKTGQDETPGIVRVTQGGQIITQPDGSFKATLLVKEAGMEGLSIVWQNIYNQTYRRELEFPLPDTPEIVNLQQIRLPINFLELQLTNIAGAPLTADTVILTHQQSGQAGIGISEEEEGLYSSVALVDGSYGVRIIKEGYQDVERSFTISGGQQAEISVTLRNYVTVSGTVVDGRGDRVAGAAVTFSQQHSQLTSPTPIQTAKDGQFLATLLVKHVNTESLRIQWSSPDGRRQYHLEAEFQLPASPKAEWLPLSLGEYELPINFLTLEVHDVAARGLGGAQVTFLTETGEELPGIERGDGIYESPDLPDGFYDILINKAGYKENMLISDVAVGPGSRQKRVGPIKIPHYVLVTGILLNGKEEGVANVEVTFGGIFSEQLEQCYTDNEGHFETTLLVTDMGEETWYAVWKAPAYYSADGTFMLPGHPRESVRLGEISLPINFLSVPVEDVYHRPLEDVTFRISLIDGSSVRGGEFLLEEKGSGIYEAQYLPDGLYRVILEKDGYEVEKQVNVNVNGGVHVILEPVTLGHYVVVQGRALNGKQEPVEGASITFSEHASTVLIEEFEELEDEMQSEDVAERPEPSASIVTPVVITDEQGDFSAKILVRLPRKEQVVVSWGQHYSASFPLDFRDTPGIQHVNFPLPINFLQVRVQDVRDRPLSGATVTFTHQHEKVIFPAVEGEDGNYESLEGLPDGTYVVQVKKARYETQQQTWQVRGGEIKYPEYQLQHYVTVRGHVIDGKGQDVAAATIQFDTLKSLSPEKTLSGPDGLFEVALLVQETGQETGTVSWVGRHGTYTKAFGIELPAEPAVIMAPEEKTLLPINFIALEVKSVAATGISGASVTFTHRKTGQTIEAKDRDKGNYEGEELLNGTYDITIVKENYQDIKIENVAVKGGEYKLGIPVPKFQHYITINGMVLNGKKDGVSEATVQVTSPRRVQECDAVTTRQDGSFTLSALVTDVGVEPLDISWNETYTLTVPVQLPTFPENLQLEPVTLPINFIIASIRDVYGDPLSGAAISFLRQDHFNANSSPNPDSSATIRGQELPDGRYESAELPDGSYLVIVSKEGYRQESYEPVRVQNGQTISDVALTLPHIVTVQGVVKNGRQQGIAGADIVFGDASSLHSSEHVATDASGRFREDLLVTGTGQESLTISVSGPPYTRTPEERFTLQQIFDIHSEPGDQDLRTLIMPINYIPIRVQNVSQQPLSDADVTLTWIAPVDGAAMAENTPLERPESRPLEHHVRNLEDGRYEGVHLKDGRYLLTVSKDGYQSQTRTVSVSGGEIAAEAVFVLPHYITVNGMITNGKGDGVPDAILEFDAQNSSLISNGSGTNGGNKDASQTAQTKPRVTTDARGHFSARLLVKKAGVQRIRVVWQERYVKQLSLQLPEQPVEYVLDNEIRLPINFVPVRVTNVLGEGLAGVEIMLKKSGTADEEGFLLHSLGSGFYETHEIPDGVYTMTVGKEGYQEMIETISVQGGEQAPEHQFVLSHSVVVHGVIVNGKGGGVSGAKVSLTGLSCQLLDPETSVLTQADGSFELEVLVTGSEQAELPEHIEVSWKNGTQPFGLAHDFQLPAVPGHQNLGILSLPANFATVAVQDFSGKGLSEATVTFIDEKGKTFPAQEVMNGLYEGQNLPDGVYTIKVAKPGYKEDYQAGIPIGNGQQTVSTMFQLPYYVTLQGVAVDGKGQTLTADVNLKLEESLSHLVPETVTFRPDGQFSTELLVNTAGKESLQVSSIGEYGLHTRQVVFVLPTEPGTVNLQRITLPMNFVPIEIKDLLGYGIEDVTVTLKHLETGKEMSAQDNGNGLYEGQQLPDGSYKIVMSKDGYKTEESPVFFVSGGIVTDTKTFQLHHYVRLTGLVINGEGGGVRDPILSIEGLRSRETRVSSGSDGTFEVEVEVQQVGNEQLLVNWRNIYRTPVVFKLPATPEGKHLGEIRLPINFLSVVVTDISGSSIRDAAISVSDATGDLVQTLRTDQNGTCKTHDIPNGVYTVTVENPGYQLETQEIYVSEGMVGTVRITLPHYMTVKGQIKDITDKPVGNVAIIFDEFTDEDGQTLRTVTHPETGRFTQNLLIDDPRFLERQRGHFQIKKGDIQQSFTFKISAEPNQTASFPTLLFPSRYLIGKVVEAETTTVPVPEASVSIAFLPESPPLPGQRLRAVDGIGDADVSTLHFTTDALGGFRAGDLHKGEYKVTIRKEGYEMYEDFVQIPGILQEKEFALQRATR